MIVSSMNVAEIRREMNRDLVEVTKAMTRQEKDFRKSHAFRFNKDQKFQCDIKTSRKNTWMAFHHITAKACNSRVVVHFPSEDGITLGHVLTDKRLLLISGHFLRRYNERCTLELTGPMAIMKHYFLHNSFFTFDASPEFNSKNMNVFSVLEKGVALGFMNEEERFIHFRTFISIDMLYPDQVNKLADTILDLGQNMIRLLSTTKEQDMHRSVKEIKNFATTGIKKIR